MHSSDVLDFWFQELKPEQWFKQSDDVDKLITERFLTLLKRARAGELFLWRGNALGRLAEIIVLDQFPRNIFRGSSQAFESDTTALVLAQEMVAKNLDADLSASKKAFAYMPYMHSESALIHQEAMQLFSAPGLEFNLEFEVEHKKIIDQFGRYPHRNKALNRESTPEELDFLKTHSGF